MDEASDEKEFRRSIVMLIERKLGLTIKRLGDTPTISQRGKCVETVQVRSICQCDIALPALLVREAEQYGSYTCPIAETPEHAQTMVEERARRGRICYEAGNASEQ